jgi:ADP-heptose:LPS heptosyltransferase
VARAEAESGRTVIVTGSASELPLACRVATLAGLPDEAVFAGRTSLLRLARLVAAAGRVVCGDTGVAHLATAFATPSVVLFGPTPPARWGPPPRRSWHRVLWAGRSGDPHGASLDPGLLRIQVDDVLAELAELDRQAAEVPA